VDFILLAFVEFIMYGCVRYFREQYVSAASLFHDPGVRFFGKVNEYIKRKMEKTRFHSVISMGTKEQWFEVSCRDRTGQVVRRQRVVQEVLITIDGKVFCRCQKPKVYHLPCSHVIAACSVSG
jgi:hypothetical protein